MVSGIRREWLSGEGEGCVWRRLVRRHLRDVREVRLTVRVGLQVVHLWFGGDLEFAQARAAQGVLLVERRESWVEAHGRERAWHRRDAVHLLLLDEGRVTRCRRPARRMVGSPGGIVRRRRTLVRLGKAGDRRVGERARRRGKGRRTRLRCFAHAGRPRRGSRSGGERVVGREVRGDALPPTLLRLWSRLADDAVES